MKVALVDKHTGEKKGWIEFQDGNHFTLSCDELFVADYIVTLLSFCGIKHILDKPPGSIEIR